MIIKASLRLGSIYNRYSEAEGALQSAIDYIDMKPGESEWFLHNVYLQLSVIYKEQGKWFECESTLEKLIEVQNEKPEKHFAGCSGYVLLALLFCYKES